MTRAQIIGLLLGCWGLYTLTASGHIHTVDSYQVYQVTRSMAERGEVNIPASHMALEGSDGRLYSKFGLGQSLLAYPLYQAARLLYRVCPEQVREGMRRGQHRMRARLGQRVAQPQFMGAWTWTPEDRFCATVVTLLFNPFLSALGLTLLASLALTLGYSRTAALVTMTMAAVGTLAWSQSRDFFQHPLVAALLLGTVLVWVRQGGTPRPLGALQMGLLGGAALLTRVFTLVWTPIFGGMLILELIRERASARRWATTLAAYLLPLLAAGALMLAYNQARFGSPSIHGYHGEEDRAGFITPLAVGLRSNLLSQERSVLLHAPPLLVALLALWGFARRHRRLTGVMLALCALYLVGYSKWWSYQGGWGLGPRFLLPVVLLLMLPLADIFRGIGLWRRLGVAGAALLSLGGAALQLQLSSLEYTSLYILHKGMNFPLEASLGALRLARWWELDYFFLTILGEVPAGWYALLLSLPLGLMAAGVYLGLLHDWLAPLRNKL